MIATQYVRAIQLKRDEVRSFKEYPFCLPAIRHLRTLDFHPKVTFIVGENGSGKSTLLEAIALAWGLNAEGGSRNFSFETRPSHSELGRFVTLVKGVLRPSDSYFFRAESYFNVATEIERLDSEGIGPRIIDYFGGRSLHEQSHGESFMALLLNRFVGEGFYILDEPEAALSPQRQLAVLTRIHDLVTHRSQFIIATHSPILMAYPTATIYNLSVKGIDQIDYYQTEHYQVTHDFLVNPGRMLDRLLDLTAPTSRKDQGKTTYRRKPATKHK
jgi:predicted ATPase